MSVDEYILIAAILWGGFGLLVIAATAGVVLAWRGDLHVQYRRQHSMPADHRLRLDDPQLACPPVRPEAAKPDPQDPIPIAQTGLWPGALEHVKLVAKNEVLEN